MLKNLLYIVFASFIFFMGYISEDFIALYETRPNQYPPYGKEVVDVNGTKFMRDIKDETNENESIKETINDDSQDNLENSSDEDKALYQK